MTPVAVLVIAGGLGAGKTTLLNALLSTASASRRRVAVIENEFGEIGIDAELLDTPSARLVALTDGCACCTLQSRFAVALAELAGHRDQFDALLVEASGVADPGPVLRSFLAHDVSDAFKVKALVTVVDATADLADLTAHPSAHRQVGFADRFALTKTERVPDGTLVALRSVLGERNPHAPIGGIADVAARLEMLLGPAPARHTASRDDAVGASPAHGFTAVAVTAEGRLDALAVDRWLAGLLAAADGRLARIKGFLAFAGDDRRHVVQGVRGQLTIECLGRWRGPRRSRLVFIGHRLDREALQAGLAACQVLRGAQAA